jgi:hypothetical protein
MIEHKPWVGEDYLLGIAGQRLAIVGHSHYLGAGEEDSPCKTLLTMREILSGERMAFFTKIMGYFDFSDPAEFWHKVMFFNFVPEAVGGAGEKYSRLPKEAVGRAQARFELLLRTYRPSRVLVFSGTAWQNCPATLEEIAHEAIGPTLGSDYPSSFTWGTYCIQGTTVQAFGLQHPQYATDAVMRRAVKNILHGGIRGF